MAIRYCDCGNKLGSRSDSGICIECYRARKVKYDQPCYLCKEPKSEHKYMYCESCREKLREEGGWHWGQMRGKDWGGDKVQVTPISEWRFK